MKSFLLEAVGQILHEFKCCSIKVCVVKSLESSCEECLVCGYFLLMLMLPTLTLTSVSFAFMSPDMDMSLVKQHKLCLEDLRQF